jgi:acetyltransferase-like isoleucine patch superfamily enzyme
MEGFQKATLLTSCSDYKRRGRESENKHLEGAYMIDIFYKIIKDLFKRMKEAYVFRKYNGFTIAEYFRKQGAYVGENNGIMIRSFGQNPYLIRIGNHYSVSCGVQLIAHDGGGWIFTAEEPSLQRFGKIEVKDNCYIGLNAIYFA